MSPLDALWHVGNLLAPPWCVAAVMALLLCLLWRPQARAAGWRRLWLWGGVGGTLGLGLGLALVGRDGSMSTYALMLAGQSLAQWWRLERAQPA
ncbi:hypothetical protein ACG0Z6_02300 [Roseateles sp. BYS180W]|uniref:Uncharacterized protein n=1 Tax=Roseateles rivi TaxID=3299028 RepID=A0ABW7FS43_9BURK